MGALAEGHRAGRRGDTLGRWRLGDRGSWKEGWLICGEDVGGDD